MGKFHHFCCEQCGVAGRYRGTRFCSRSCRTKWANLHDNPAKGAAARAKLSALARADGRQANLTTREARARAVVGIAAALAGKKQAPEVVAKRVAGCRATAARYGVMTPAHRAQLEKLHREYSGPNHHNWRGGTTKQRVKEYRSQEYKDYRKAVLARCDYRCQGCGKRGGRLDVHHCYVPYAQCSGPLAFLKYHPENGTILCVPCHNVTKTTRPGLEQPALAQLPQHVIDLIRSQVGPQLQP